MKKIKLLTPILGVSALAGATLPLASCACKKTDTTDGVIPSDAFVIKDVTLKGFKEEYDYTNYTKLVIPSNVKVIDNNAFKGLFTVKTKVTHVVIPSNVETIRSGAFGDCTNIVEYDFSQFNVDQIHKLTVEKGSFGPTSTNGIYSYFKMNDNWTEVQKESLRQKLMSDADVPNYCFVAPTEGNVELVGSKSEYADAGETSLEFKIKGYFAKSLKYKVVLTTVDGTEDVSVDPIIEDPEISEDYKTITVPIKMISDDAEHHFTNEDWVSYKVQIVCYYEKGTPTGTTYQPEWLESLGAYKVNYHNIVKDLDVTHAPYKTQYRSNEVFKPEGLAATATFSNGDELELEWGDFGFTTNLYEYEFTSEDVKAKLDKGRAIYTFEDYTVEDEFTIEMLESLSKLEIVQEAAQKEFYVGQTFNHDGLKLKASYESETPEETITTGFTTNFDGYRFTDEDRGTKTVEVTYANKGRPMTVTYDITVKALYEIYNSSTDVSFKSWPYYAIEGENLVIDYTVNTLGNKVDPETSSIKVGDNEIKDEDGVEFKAGRLTIPSELITDTITISLKTKAIDDSVKNQQLDETDWSKIGGWCDSYEKGEITRDEFIAKFKVNSGKAITSNLELIGSTSNITINNIVHKVRIIDIDHDTIANTTKKAALTIDLANVLSNEDTGITSQWNSTEDYSDYYNSTLRNNLTGEPSEEFKQALGDNVYNTLIKDETGTSKLKDYIKTVTKTYKKNENGAWVNATYNDTLFTLTATEMNRTDTYLSGEGTVYAYWNQFVPQDPFDPWIKNIAGTEYGHQYWIASPNPDTEKDAFGIDTNGDRLTRYCTDADVGISFAFCI